jgi:hypothetical protein
MATLMRESRYGMGYHVVFDAVGWLELDQCSLGSAQTHVLSPLELARDLHQQLQHAVVLLVGADRGAETVLE